MQGTYETDFDDISSLVVLIAACHIERLEQLSARMAEAGRTDEAAAAAVEQAAVHRLVAERMREDHPEMLVVPLTRLAHRARSAFPAAQSLRLSDDLIPTYRALGPTRPAFEASLAYCLERRSDSVADLRSVDAAIASLEEVLDPLEEAIGIYRRLAEAEAARYEPRLALALTQRWHRLRRAGRRDEAVGSLEESIALFRRLAQDNGRYQASLAWVTRLAKQYEKPARLHDQPSSAGGFSRWRRRQRQQ
jgi:tetratricopeptide (TPR) repeat protein